MSPNVRFRSRRGAAAAVWVVVLVAAALIITIAAALRHRQSAERVAAAATPTPAQPVPPEVMRELENIPAETWQRAGTRDATKPVFTGDSDRADGKPVVLYVGAGFCPYCAAARWPMIAALSRFGKFSGLSLGASSAEDVYPSTPTFSFYKSSYTSDYVALQSVEIRGDVRLPDGRYNPLETPTPAQEALLQKYDKPPYAPGAGGIPFILVGGRYLWTGSPFNPGVLADKSQAAIAAMLSRGSGDAAPAILSNANEFTASICAVDGGKPADVCSAPAIQSAIKDLPTKLP